jgi:hypothetical protein
MIDLSTVDWQQSCCGGCEYAELQTESGEWVRLERHMGSKDTKATYYSIDKKKLLRSEVLPAA